MSKNKCPNFIKDDKRNSYGCTAEGENEVFTKSQIDEMCRNCGKSNEESPNEDEEDYSI